MFSTSKFYFRTKIMLLNCPLLALRSELFPMEDYFVLQTVYFEFSIFDFWSGWVLNEGSAHFSVTLTKKLLTSIPLRNRMVSIFSYIFKAKCILIRVQCPVVALIVNRKSLKQSGPQSNPDKARRAIKIVKGVVELLDKGKYTSSFLKFLCWFFLHGEASFYKNLLNTVSNLFVLTYLCL
jgi:hypothetical protein